MQSYTINSDQKEFIVAVKDDCCTEDSEQPCITKRLQDTVVGITG